MNGQTVDFPKRETLCRLALSESGFVFDPVTGNSFTVNTTGLSILRQLQRWDDWNQVITSLLEEFEIEAHVIERDVIEFASSLRSAFK